MNKEDQEIIVRSESIAIKYLKDTYNLDDVVITRRQLHPKMAMSQVSIYGYVEGKEEQNFIISINYETGLKEMFAFSKELKKYLLGQGYNL
ncbi:hypothetical protein YWY31_52860 [Paenibacillus illinoisensis]|uniref:hypothetical protein n=1 Tax=Paenibacillus illinoisensis TaxID=59845 RepID=UPI0034AC021D